ncbi:MAG: HD domain-containing protein, partial [Bryobacteraceae bacterium]
VDEVMDAFQRDDFVKVKALMQVYQNRPQLTLHRLRRLEDHEVDFADFFPCSERDPEEMFAELRGVIAGIGNEHLRALLESIFSDERLAAAYKIAPAAKNIHHARRGGLIEHVLSLCELCQAMAAHYKNIDRDLLLTGAILHDIGKTEELSYTRSFGYSADGQLLGHIVIGLRMVGSKVDRMPSFPPKLRTLVEHLIVSHHGVLEFGSPKVPAFPEALLLHHLDNLDSKMEAMRAALSREDPSDSEFTPWIVPLDRILLRRERYLAEAAPAAQKPEPAPDRPAEPPSKSAIEENTNPPEPKKPEERPVPATPFGEKLQAVLASNSEPEA